MKSSFRTNSASAALACIAAMASLALPSVGIAADIAWSAERVSATMATGKRVNESRAVFKTGDKASIRSECLSGPYDDKGWATTTCDSDIAFEDGSHIYMSFRSRHDEKTLAATAEGTFKGGTKRYEGISGSATGVGLTGRMQWTGTYALPEKK